MPLINYFKPVEFKKNCKTLNCSLFAPWLLPTLSTVDSGVDLRQYRGFDRLNPLLFTLTLLSIISVSFLCSSANRSISRSSGTHEGPSAASRSRSLRGSSGFIKRCEIPLCSSGAFVAWIVGTPHGLCASLSLPLALSFFSRRRRGPSRVCCSYDSESRSYYDRVKARKINKERAWC